MATVAQMREEMRRIADVLVAKNAVYLRREAELMAKLEGQPPWKVLTELDNDFLLNHTSGSAKTCAALVTGLATAILAELAAEDHLMTYRSLPD